MPPRRFFGLIKITKYFCITPNYNNKTKKFNNKLSWKITQISVLITICLMYIGELYYFQTVIAKKIQPHEKLIINTLNAMLVFINLFAAIQVTFTKRNEWESTIKKISKILKKLKGLINVEEVEFSTYISYVIKHLVLVINFIFFVLSKETEIYIVILSQNGNIEIILLTLVMDDISTFLRFAFRKINEIIARELDTEIKIESLDVISVKRTDENYSEVYKKTKIIQKLTEIYSDCYDVINFYNDLFGWIIVLICLYAVVGVLPGLESIIWKIIPNNYSHLYTVIWTITTSAFKLSLCLIIIKSCHETTEEGNLIKITATNAMQLLPDSDKYDNLQNELNLLVDLNDRCSPVFSAAGVLPVDNSLFYILFTMITSYLIVLIQFLQSPSDENQPV